MKCDFSYIHYRNVLKKALKEGFSLTNFRDYERIKSSPRVIILRHDIDSFPHRDLRMAQIENDLGIKSTFFVRVHGQYYYPFEQNTFLNLKQIMELGHEIGLHSEARTLAPLFQINMVDFFLREKKMLEKILDIEIISASEHAYLGRPEKFWQDHFFTKVKKQRVGIENFPQEKRFQKYHYLSDSLGHWREGCICKNLKKYDYIQLLIHAALWGKGGKEAVKKLLSLS
jgi:hypothetical protein